MKKTRATITAIWTIKPQAAGMPFAIEREFIAYANRALYRAFAAYDSRLSITLRAELNDELTDLDVVWSFDLDGVPGTWHQPEDHVRHMTTALLDNIRAFAAELRIVSVDTATPAAEPASA